MPSYDYLCRACGQQSELVHRMSDPPVRVCPRCGAESLERLVSSTAFTLRGGGWYADGYGGSKPGEGAAKTEPKTDAKPETKTESKPAAEAAPAAPKPEPKPS